MKIAVVTLKSVGPYSQSRNYDREVPMLEKESKDDYEKRTWRNKLHVNAAGFVVMPASAFKFAVDGSARFLSQKIPGKRNATYTKHFLAGVLVLDDVELSIKAADVRGEWFFVNSDGVRGSGKRVYKCFPMIDEWEATVTFHIADETITREVFEEHLRESGKFIGVGRFAPRVGGKNGRYEVVSVKWS